MQPQAFDSYAIHYDDHFTNSLIGDAQRKQVYRHVKNNVCIFNQNILEINCGTGEDAIWLARQDARVLATDVSLEMLNIAQSKIQGEPIKLKQLAAEEIESLEPQMFQMIFSNFGGLNCLSPAQIELFARGCARLQNKGDQVALVIMGTKCLWEKIYFRKDKEKAKRRSNKEGVDTEIGGHRFKTYYYSPADMERAFGSEYSCVNTRPVGLFVPPSYLEPYFVKRKILLGTLRFLDRVCSFSFLSDYADHYIIILKKKR